MGLWSLTPNPRILQGSAWLEQCADRKILECTETGSEAKDLGIPAQKAMSSVAPSRCHVYAVISIETGNSCPCTSYPCAIRTVPQIVQFISDICS